jgi:transcriptional regulator with XRE-family HTH domain
VNKGDCFPTVKLRKQHGANKLKEDLVLRKGTAMFKLKASKRWYKEAAELEKSYDISAGPEILEFSSPSDSEASRPENVQVGFSKFMHKLRISIGLSVDELAKKIDVDREQLILIENKTGYKAPPRTLSRLAKVYNLPTASFLQLAGATKATDERLQADILRFAAESDSFEKLSKEEKKLLGELIRVIRDHAST